MKAIDSLTEAINDLSLEGPLTYEAVNETLISICGIEDPSPGLIRRIIKRCHVHKCLCCSYYAESKSDLKRHLRIKKRCRYGQERIKDDKKSLVDRIADRFKKNDIKDEEAPKVWADVRKLNNLTIAERLTMEEIYFIEGFLVRL